MTAQILQIPQLCTSLYFVVIFYLFLMELSTCYEIMFHTQLRNDFVKELPHQQQLTDDKANSEYINTLPLFCFSVKTSDLKTSEIYFLDLYNRSNNLNSTDYIK
jgi:hypothetical protein